MLRPSAARKISAALLFVMAGAAFAQQPASLILDEEPAAIKATVRKSKKKDAAGTAKDGTGSTSGEAVATPKPEEILVAIVNSRVLTRADLEARVSSRFEQILEKVQSEKGGILGTIDPDNVRQMAQLPEEKLADVAKGEILEGQEIEVERALRQEEASSVQQWVEFSLLAEEARRQGIVIGDDEFRTRLEQAEELNSLDDATVDRVLRSMRMSRQDYEKYVYDALMIERLLGRFIEINFDEDYKRRAYNSNPVLFQEPEKFQIAHFAITVPPEAALDRKAIADYRAKAMKVRTLLREGKNPEDVFALPEFNQLSAGVFGSIPGWFTFRERALPPIVEDAGLKLKVGETSDVLLNQKRSDGQIVPVSFHVIRIQDRQAASGQTFETALPAIDRALLEVARDQVLERIRAAKSHRVLLSLGGIRPDKVPSREEIWKAEAEANPISLKIATGTAKEQRKS